MNITTLHLVLLIAATWRLANLLANEDGPFHMFKTLRSKIGRAEARSRLNERKGLKGRKVFLAKLHLFEGVQCEYCNSVWFGIFFAGVYFLAPSVATALALPLALSTGAILIKKVVFVLSGIDTYFDRLNNPPAPKVVAEKQPLTLRDAIALGQKIQADLEKGGS